MSDLNNKPQYKLLDTKNHILEDFAASLSNYSAISSPLQDIASNEDENAKIFLSTKQKIFIMSLFMLVLGSCIIDINAMIYSFLLFVNFLYILVLSLRNYIISYGQKCYTHLAVTDLLTDDELPFYTIMVPLYKEAEVAQQLILNLKNLDYPKNKLQILIILEEIDHETQKAVNALQLDDHFFKIIVPNTFPQTKPKACNYALQYAIGEYLVIYDAEDKPDPQQLKQAIAHFKTQDTNTVCYQAILTYYNSSENWLSKMFTIEYAILFQRILPAFQYLNLPIPLGGTSNHFKTQTLRRLGGWDSYNVTEDADIGIQCAKKALKIKILPSTTEEESPISFKNWFKQRSRWIKGFIQTYFVHMRNPLKLYRSLGLKGFLAFNILFGLCNFLYILVPLAFIILPLIKLHILVFETYKINLICTINLISLIYSILSIAWSAVEIRHTNTRISQIKCNWSYPLYILLLPIAALFSWYQIFTNLHFWEKTKHGVTTIKNQGLKF